MVMRMIYSIVCAVAGMLAGVAVTAIITSKRDTEEHVFSQGVKTGKKQRTIAILEILEDAMYDYPVGDVRLVIEDVKAEIYKLSLKEDKDETEV